MGDHLGPAAIQQAVRRVPPRLHARTGCTEGELPAGLRWRLPERGAWSIRLAQVDVVVLVCALAAVLLAAVAVVVAVLALRRTRALAPRPGAPALPEDVVGLRREVAALQASAEGALRHLAVVRYDAFGDVGGHLSWSVALLDDSGHGVVLSSIHGRSEARTYAKTITSWSSDALLSPEEQEAVSHARP